VFIDRPTAEGLRLLTLGAKDFLRYEVEEVLPQVLTAGFPAHRVDALTDGHDALAARLNRLAWAEAGTVELQTEALQFRHELLSHADLYNDLRLPRGALIPGG